MRKLLFMIPLLLITLAGFSQPFSGFLKPVKDNPALKGLELTDKGFSDNVALIRFTAGVEANQYIYNKVSKSVEQKFFSKAGFGLSYAFYSIREDGTPYSDFSVNALVLTTLADESPQLSFAVTGTFWQYISAGLDFQPSLVGSDYFPLSVLFGAKYKF